MAEGSDLWPWALGGEGSGQVELSPHSGRRRAGVVVGKGCPITCTCVGI